MKASSITVAVDAFTEDDVARCAIVMQELAGPLRLVPRVTRGAKPMLCRAEGIPLNDTYIGFALQHAGIRFTRLDRRRCREDQRTPAACSLQFARRVLEHLTQQVAVSGAGEAA